MSVVKRSICSSSLLLLILILGVVPVWSEGRAEVGALTLTFRYHGEAISRGEFKDRTTYDQSATIVCPVTAGDITSISSIMGPTKEQEQANLKLGEAAKKEIDAISPKTVSGMKSIEKQMKECKAAGKSDQICGMQMMMAMQTNPELMEGMAAIGHADEKGRAAADQAVAAAADNYQPWFNEGCTGTMTVNNTFQLDDPTIPGPEPILRTTGTRKIETRDTLVTIETDLKRNETRYMIIPPQGTFTRDASPGEQPSQENLMAIPANPVVAGPYPGPIQTGRFDKSLSGGSYSIEWVFAKN